MNKLHYGILLILAIMLFSVIPILRQTGLLQENNNQIPKQSVQAENETTEPVFINVSTNTYRGMLPDGDFRVTAVVENADTCILSYMYVLTPTFPNLGGNSSGEGYWINVTMVKSGNVYNGSIDTHYGYYPICDFQWKIYANDVYGHSVVKDGESFRNWYDP